MRNDSALTKGSRAFDIVNMVLLSLILVAVLYPLLFVISASLSDPVAVLQGRVLLLPVDPNLLAYQKVFENGDIWNGYRNTILYTVVGTAVNLALTVAAAYPLSRKDFKERNLVTAIFTFTMFFSGGMIPTYLVIKQLGLLNKFWVMIFPNAVTIWNIIITRTYFQTSIPAELQEAAFLDGSSNFGVLFRVILPLSPPILAVMTLFYGVGHWNEFFNALIYLSDRSLFPIQVILREILIQNQMQMMTLDEETVLEQQMLAEGIKYSVIIVASVPVLLLYPFLQRYFVKGVMIGAIKA